VFALSFFFCAAHQRYCPHVREDWIAIDSLEKNNYIYRINVCNDVLFKPNKSMTPLLPGTGAYQQKIDTIRSHNLGLTASPYVEGERRK